MPRVLHILPHRGGGGEAVVEMLSAGLGQYDHRVLHLARARRPLAAAPSLASGLLRARREARHADLLHVVGDTAALLCASLFSRHRGVWGTHGLSLLRRLEGPPAVGAPRGAHTLVSRSRRTICQSRQELDELAAIVGPALAPKLFEVHNGIALPPLPDADDRAAARRRLGLAEGTAAVLYMGDLEDCKRPLDAVEAALRAAQGAPIELLVAGDGPLAGEVAEVAAAGRLGRDSESAPDDGVVRTLGFVRDPTDLLVAADVFVMPSEREGLSLALLEAMGYGLAIVASDGRGIPETIGDAGLLHPVGDIDSLARTLVRLAHDPGERRRLGDAGRARVEARFSIERFLAEMDAVFAAALDGASRA